MLEAEDLDSGINAQSGALASGAIVRNSGDFTCTGTVDVPPLASTTDTMNTITCALDENPATTCEFTLFIGPHPLLDCPGSVPPLRPSDAAASTGLFESNPAVTCVPAAAADIPGDSFPSTVEDEATFTVECSSTETPNTCSFDIVLHAGAPQLPFLLLFNWACSGFKTRIYGVSELFLCGESLFSYQAA